MQFLKQLESANAEHNGQKAKHHGVHCSEDQRVVFRFLNVDDIETEVDRAEHHRDQERYDKSYAFPLPTLSRTYGTSNVAVSVNISVTLVNICHLEHAKLVVHLSSDLKHGEYLTAAECDLAVRSDGPSDSRRQVLVVDGQLHQLGDPRCN